MMTLFRAYFLILALFLASLPAAHANSANGIRTPADLIAYLNEIDGNHVISGEFVGPGPIFPINGIHTSTGKWLGMIGGDYFQYDGGGIVTSFNPIAIDYWNAGGLITLTLSIPNPTTDGDCHDVSRLNTAELLTPGTATHNKYVFMLNQIADALRALQTAGVVVILRPYHELNGNWFWWGTKFLSTAQFQSLWKFTHYYLTKTKGLHNLVWLYSVNANVVNSVNDKVGSLTARYPGDSYVDVTGFDLYSSDPAQGIPSYNTMVSLGKPTSLSEFGPSNPQLGSGNFQQTTLISALQNQMQRITFWQQWWDRNAGKPGWGMERMQNLPAALSNARVLNRNDISHCTDAGRAPGCKK
jgi:mannan endo-1,4-beta-mannosidase